MKKLKIKKFGKFAKLNRKWKILFTELFKWTKKCTGKIPVYGGKIKSVLLAEKKLAYGRIKKFGQ